MFAPFSVPFPVGWWRNTATCSFLLQIYLQWDSPFLMLSQILAVLYWYQPMFLWRFRIDKDDPFSFGWQRNNLAFQAPPSQLFLQIWKGPRRPKWTGLGVTTGHQSPSRKYSLQCKVDTPFTDNLVSDTWFRWLGNNCLNWIWDGGGFIMVSSVRHLEHPEIPYLNTSSPKISLMHTRSSIFSFLNVGFSTL